jgi:hypothetical protein
VIRGNNYSTLYQLLVVVLADVAKSKWGAVSLIAAEEKS